MLSHCVLKYLINKISHLVFLGVQQYKSFFQSTQILRKVSQVVLNSHEHVLYNQRINRPGINKNKNTKLFTTRILIVATAIQYLQWTIL